MPGPSFHNGDVQEMAFHTWHKQNAPRATACPWHSPHALQWAVDKRHRWGPPFYHGTASSTVLPSAPGHQQSAPSRSWHSWSGLDGKGHSWKSAAAAHQWWHGTSGRCIFRGPGLSHDCDTGDKDVSQHSWQTQYLPELPGRGHSGSTQDASCYSWLW